jgi:hypothetical protein
MSDFPAQLPKSVECSRSSLGSGSCSLAHLLGTCNLTNLPGKLARHMVPRPDIALSKKKPNQFAAGLPL